MILQQRPAAVQNPDQSQWSQPHTYEMAVEGAVASAETVLIAQLSRTIYITNNVINVQMWESRK